MTLKTSVSESRVQRGMDFVASAQRAAGAEMSEEGTELLRQQLRGEITVDQAVAVIADRARRLSSRA